MRKHFFYLALFILIGFPIISFCQSKKVPTLEIVHSGMKTSLRGLSVVNDNVVWVSGSNGTVGKTSNGGKNWKWMTVKGFEKKDFRDIEAFDASTAIIMAIEDPAYILKTTDGGESWKVVYENKTKGMFLDAMDFRDEINGVVIGDPVDGHFFIAKTNDGGDTWQELSKELRPATDSGEAFFASSGTNIRYLYNKSVVMISGGKNSRVFYDYKPTETPLTKGKETAGGNSVAVFDNHTNTKAKNMVIAGGDFTKDTSIINNCFYTKDGGKKWLRPKTPPNGYRSCVEYLDKKTLVSCGLNGVDFSFDGGKNWYPVSKEGFHACRFAKIGGQVYLSGSNGKIGKLVWKK